MRGRHAKPTDGLLCATSLAFFTDHMSMSTWLAPFFYHIIGMGPDRSEEKLLAQVLVSGIQRHMQLSQMKIIVGCRRAGS